MIANKMESSGQEGLIHVSETTKRLLEKAYKNQYRFERQEDVEIKTLNQTIAGYFVYRNDDRGQIEDDQFVTFDDMLDNH